jgi:hypothetical protein
VERIDEQDAGDLLAAATASITGDSIVGTAIYILPSMYNHDCGRPPINSFSEAQVHIKDTFRHCAFEVAKLENQFDCWFMVKKMAQLQFVLFLTCL